MNRFDKMKRLQWVESDGYGYEARNGDDFFETHKLCNIQNPVICCNDELVTSLSQELVDEFYHWVEDVVRKQTVDDKFTNAIGRIK